ncbi:serine/threonine-protein kinase [Aporhodopirellula aestuarii]|uniref:Protein kinase n=1 Tax=Aporhodopirellula aestuarii TaxID=2950107 RepID=A0ABT0U482_9BACT|nr:serine/threonine protein kinase [Aporhodopirellula aestuarii]MCM2371712.1 protein kinase [Aporhodopirellula aestuarii]
MDPSSAIRPEASTVHRAESTGEGASTDPPAINEQELEAAETVIRQDPLAAFPGGAYPDEGSARRGDSGTGGSAGGEPPSRGSGSGSLRGPSHHTPASLTRDLQGQRLNHFELLEQIGGGGMGAVFRAVDERLGRTVAVKVVPFAAGDPDLQRRFRNEAQSAAKLDHPLIARVFEVGNDGPWYYIVFEYIDGRNIRDIVSNNGPLSLDDAVYYTCQVAEAIGHASRRGIVHRDIKPSNVVVTEESSIKLVDMGLARSESFDTSEDMTASGVTLGTFDYISPEQAHDPRLADIRSDLYSLGCTFFYMLTGSPPYPGGTMLQKLLNHGNAAIPDIREQCDEASDDLAAIIRKMLAKQPDQRYQDSQSLIADLRELALRENLRRSRGVDVVTVEGDNAMLRRILRHLPWVVAASVLFISVVALEMVSWQERREFNSQLATTVPPDALESVPVLNAASSIERTRDALPRGAFGTLETPGYRNPDFTPSTNDEAIGFPSPINSGASLGNPDGGSLNAPTTEFGATIGVSPSAGNTGTNLPGPGLPGSRESVDPSAGPRLPIMGPQPPLTAPTLGPNSPSVVDVLPGFNPNGSRGIPELTPPPTSVATSTNPITASDTRRTGMNRLPGDPPSLQNFPLPVGSDIELDETGDVALSPRVPSFSGMDVRDNDSSPVALSGNDTDRSTTVDQTERTTILDPPHLVRIVTAEAMQSMSIRESAEMDGVVLTTSLADALELARRHQVEQIDIDTPMLASGPVVVDEDDLVIASSVPGGTAIVFTSNREVDMQRSDMLTIGSNRIDLVDVHLYWTVPASETDGGSMLAMNDNRQVRLTDCSITIDNPSRRDEIHAFNIVTDTDSSEVRGTRPTRTSTSPANPLPLISIELYNVIVRGQISMLRMDIAAELQLLWENGLLAVSRRMIETGGSVQRPQPKSGSIRLSLQRLTAYVPRGLLAMRLGVSSPYPVAIERQAEESVFVVDRGVPHVEITGISREDEDQSWLRIRGASNAYEADTTLSDPLFVVRDQSGQKTTTTLNDLIVNQPVWADERTPRWVVRWSQPLPDSISVSRLVPADFRQDGSLFAGFQEKSLPKLPMQRTLDFSFNEAP